MERQQFEQRWHHLSTEIMSGLSDWRLQHPKATLREMELELDTRLAHVRARMLEDLALASAASDWRASPAGEALVCPQCASLLQPRGTHPRTLQTQRTLTNQANHKYSFL